MSYQLENLSPPEFTELTGDLLREELKVRLSKSPEGPDGGIDLLRSGAGNRFEIVVQCKHYINSSFSALKRDLMKEIEKVERLNPQRYIVVTSMPLTVSKKDEIRSIFPAYILSLDDIYGQQDIDSLLRTYPIVERNHYKLWLGSVALLSRIVHQGTSVWHQQLLARLEEHKQVYVQTPSFANAIDILNKHRIVLIAGGPGIGKTTLANVLSANFVAQGFEFREIIDLEHDIKDLPEEGNVILYYDDFLGHSVWRDTTPGSEKRLENLIRLAEKCDRFWLIMTTRTYLLEDARRVSTAVEQRLKQKHEVVLHVDEMSLSTRAKILYNHLYFNRVSPDACESLTDWKRLSGILNHANFNPRIIEYVTKDVPGELPASKYADFIENHLRQPKTLYESAIRDRIGVESRDVLFVLHVLGELAELNHIYRIWMTLRRELDQASENQEVFRRKTKALDANLIKLIKLFAPQGKAPRDGLNFYNPGVGEMVRDLLWLYDDRWLWFCRTAESGRELLNLARCNPEVKQAGPFASSSLFVALPEVWYVRWEELLYAGVADEDDTAKALGQAIALQVWDDQPGKLVSLLNLWHDCANSGRIPWNRLGTEWLSKAIQQALAQVPWLSAQLREEVDEFVRDQRFSWDSEVAGEIYDALDNLGASGVEAIIRLQEAGRETVRSFVTSHYLHEEISEDDFDHASSINDNLHLGLDNELAELEHRIRRSSSRSTVVSSPKIADDPLSEAEVRAMFTSLTLGNAREQFTPAGQAS